MGLTRIVVLISGEGTNLQALIDASVAGVLPECSISHVFSNKAGVGGLTRAANANIRTTVVEWEREKETRDVYDARLAVMVKRFRPQIVVLAGWMHILSAKFLVHFFDTLVVNLHPALPGQFPGLNAIERAFHAKVEYTGVMCHTVVEEIDAGRVLYSMPIPILDSDTVETLTARVKLLEKTVLIMGMLKAIKELQVAPPPAPKVSIIKSLIRKGKVRDVYSLTFEECSEPQALMMVATDRFSCFDRNVCEIPQKGIVLNRLSAWWFERTKHIVHNHLYQSETDSPISFVRPCRVFPVEFVVRGFITGSTNTSMWTLYNQGVRSFGPIDATISDDSDSPPLKKNQKLPRFMVTPTTKSDTHDEPITTLFQLHDLMTIEQFKECHSIALKLFERGQEVALTRGLILVDTKYEFGLDEFDSIVLVDEIHTCDSSRYWDASTYQKRFEAGLEPHRFDKDIIRTWIREQCDPYSAMELPKVTDELIETTSKRYIEFYERLTGEKHVDGFPSNSIIESAAISKFFRLFPPV